MVSSTSLKRCAQYAVAGHTRYYPLGETVPVHKAMGGDWAEVVHRTDKRGRRRVVRMVYEAIERRASAPPSSHPRHQRRTDPRRHPKLPRNGLGLLTTSEPLGRFDTHSLPLFLLLGRQPAPCAYRMTTSYRNDQEPSRATALHEFNLSTHAFCNCQCAFGGAGSPPSA